MDALAVSCFVLLLSVSADGASVGVNYGRVADDLPEASEVVNLLQSQGIKRAKLYDADPRVLKAFANTSISLVVALPNEQLAAAAADQNFAQDWVQTNVSTFLPHTQIEAIAVGNEVFADPQNTTQYLVRAMENVHASLVKLNRSTNIKVVSPIALSALNTSYPPSAGSFEPKLIDPAIKPMLRFLRKTGSYLMVNVYPFFAYSANSDEISLDYALFKDNPGVVDPRSGLRYQNLFDAQIDAVNAALSALEYGDLKLVVSETGWPSKGDASEVGAGLANAAAYNGNLVKRVLNGSGTPSRPKDPIDVFLFALFNENQKTGPTSEQNYGLFYPDEQKVYDVPLTLAALNSSGDNGTTVNGSKARVPLPPAPSPAPGQTWCVANEAADERELQKALDYACGEGGADCSLIQNGSRCYKPNTVAAHASYAFNNYYEKNKRARGACFFRGLAHIVQQPPTGCADP